MLSIRNIIGPRPGFEGGLFLPEYKSVTARRPIERLRADGTLYVPLRVGLDLETSPVVKPGAKVLGGQRLATPASAASVAVHAPTSGAVLGIDRVWTAHDGFLPCAILEPDGRDERLPPGRLWMDESFTGQLADKGVVCPSPRGPAHWVLRQAAQAGVSTLIVNAMETEPYLAADLRTLVEEPGRLVDMTCEIADSLGVERVFIAVPFRHRRVVRRMEAEAVGRHVLVASLAGRYPQCHPIMLVKALLDLEVSPGGSVLDVGAAVIPLSVVRSAAEAVLDDRAATHAVMTIAGDAVERPGVYRVAVGTPVRRLAERVGLTGTVASVISGGPLTGVSVGRDDAVVTAETTAMLFFRRGIESEPLACIRCGWCVEDCPVGLDPAGLVQLESEGSIEAEQVSHLRACIDCGLCSYVCPTSLPLAATIRRIRARHERGQESAS